MNADSSDLQRFARRGDEAAFERLVAEYLPLVYSTAIRMVNRDEHLAHDIAQLVFANLANKAETLPENTVLAGWLHCDTRFTALEVLRKQKRRRDREAVASQLISMEKDDATAEWDEISPILDDALNALPPEARDVVLLRFFQRRTLKQVGERLGIGESGASRRISNAIEALRQLLRNEGVTVSSAGLVALLTARSLEAIPVSQLAILLASVKSAPSTATTVAATSSLALFMSTNLKLAAIGAAVCALLLGGFAWKTRNGADAKTRQKSEEPVPDATPSGNARAARSPATPIPAAAKSSELDPRLARVRAILYAKGRISYPPPDLKQALEDLQPNRQAALPILIEALRDASVEVRRRALGGITILNGDARDGVPAVIELLWQSTDSTEGFLAAHALESIGTNPEIIPDLAEVMKQNPNVRMEIANIINTLVQPGSPEAARAAGFFRPLLNDPDPSLAGEAARVLATLGDKSEQRLILQSALTDLNLRDDNAQVRALTTLANMGDAGTNAVPALRRYLTSGPRADLKMSAAKMLKNLDTNYANRQSSPEFANEQQERAAILSAHIARGTATTDELVQALTEGPQAVTIAARALATKGFEKLGAKNPTKLSEAVIALNSIAQGDQPLETRVAAAHAFAALQPMRPRPIYTTDELANALNTLRADIDRTPAASGAAARRALDGTLDTAGVIWSNTQHRTGNVTDYPAPLLSSLARELKAINSDLGAKFEREMRKVDPNFR